MAMRACNFFFYLFLILRVMVKAQERAPHGLASQNPVAFSPSAYDFFHPNAQKQDDCVTSKCSPFPLAAQLQRRESQQPTAPEMSKLNVGAAAIADSILSRVLTIIFLALSMYYVI